MSIVRHTLVLSVLACLGLSALPASARAWGHDQSERTIPLMTGPVGGGRTEAKPAGFASRQRSERNIPMDIRAEAERLPSNPIYKDAVQFRITPVDAASDVVVLTIPPRIFAALAPLRRMKPIPFLLQAGDVEVQYVNYPNEGVRLIRLYDRRFNQQSALPPDIQPFLEFRAQYETFSDPETQKISFLRCSSVSMAFNYGAIPTIDAAGIPTGSGTDVYYPFGDEPSNCGERFYTPSEIQEARPVTKKSGDKKGAVFVETTDWAI